MITFLRSPALWLFVVAVLVLSAGIGLREPWPPDEPRFALVAKDMVDSGDWLIPRVGGVLYPDKPPLFFWFVALVYAVTGSLAVAVLTPGLLAGLVILWLVYDLAGRLWGAEAALWTGAALLVTFQFPLEMKAGQIDGFLCLWTTLGLYGFTRHLLLGPDWRWYAAAGFACGLGVITKGVGFLPFLLFLPWVVASRSRWPVPAIGGGVRWLLAPAAAFVAIALWLVPMWLATTGSADSALLQYRDDILLRQTVTRYAEPWGHLKPAWYLFSNAIPWLWLPLSFMLPWLLPAWRNDLRNRVPATLLFASWIMLVLLFFSLSEGKRSVYILPALPALALLAGRHMPAISARTGARWLLFLLAALFASLPIVLGVGTLVNHEPLRAFLAEPSRAAVVSSTAICIGCLAWAALAMYRVRRAAQGFAAVMAVLWIAVPLLIYPLIDSTRSGAALAEGVAARMHAGEVAGFAGWKEQLLLQWDRPVVHFGYRRDDLDESRDAARWLSASGKNRLVLPETHVEPCFEPSKLAPLGLAHREYWFMADPSAVRPSCRAGPGVPDVRVTLYDPAERRGTANVPIKNARQRPGTARSATR